MKWIKWTARGEVFPTEGDACFGDISGTRWIRRVGSASRRSSGSCSPTDSDDKLVIVPNGHGGLDVYPERNGSDLSDRVGGLPGSIRSVALFQYQYLSEGARRDARSAGTNPDPCSTPRERRPDEGRADHRHAGALRGLEQRAVRALRARQDRRAHRGRRKRNWPTRACSGGAGGHAPPGAGGRSDVSLAPPTRGLGGGRDDRHGWTRGAAAGGGRRRTRVCSASIAIPRRWRARARAPRALRRSRDAAARQLPRPRAPSRAGRRRAGGGDPPRPRAVVVPARRAPGAASASRETSRSTCASTPPRATTAADLLADSPRKRSSRASSSSTARSVTRGASPAASWTSATARPLAHRRRPGRRGQGARSRAPPGHTRTHVATRTFQALRMAVNEEPERPREALEAAPRCSRTAAASASSPSTRARTASSSTPSGRCAGRGFVELEPSPVTAVGDETRDNPRARSAKLRVLERMEAA